MTVHGNKPNKKILKSKIYYGITQLLTNNNGFKQELNLRPKSLDTAPHFPQLPLSLTKSSPISKHCRRDMHMCHLGCKKKSNGLACPSHMF